MEPEVCCASEVAGVQWNQEDRGENVSSNNLVFRALTFKNKMFHRLWLLTTSWTHGRDNLAFSEEFGTRPHSVRLYVSQNKLLRPRQLT